MTSSHHIITEAGIFCLQLCKNEEKYNIIELELVQSKASFVQGVIHYSPNESAISPLLRRQITHFHHFLSPSHAVVKNVTSKGSFLWYQHCNAMKNSRIGRFLFWHFCGTSIESNSRILGFNSNPKIHQITQKVQFLRRPASRK